jgi:hypothetical protein
VIYIFAIAALLITIQTTLLETVRVAGILPDVLLILAVYASRFLSPQRAALAGAIIGSLAALTARVEWSILPALYAIAGWLASQGWRQFLRASGPIEIAFLLPLGFLVNVVILVFEYGLGARFLRAAVATALPNAAATAIAGPLAFAAVKKRLHPLIGGSRPRAARRR